MASLPLRARASLRTRMGPSSQLSSSITAPRSLSSLTTAHLATPKSMPAKTKDSFLTYPKPSQLRKWSSSFQRTVQTEKSQAYSTSSNAPTADAIIEELQDLYEIAKDEFEIATESTDGGTIYAASDRDSARDALNDFCATYFLYTHKPGEEDTGIVLRSGEKLSGSKLLTGGVILGESEDGNGRAVDTSFEPSSVETAVRNEVRKRIGQRVRELRNAVELLEERAMEE